MEIELKDVLTILIALYGAVVSSYIVYRDRQKDIRKLNLYYEVIEEISGEKISRIVIHNPGPRPISITQLGLRLYHDNPSTTDLDAIQAFNLDFAQKRQVSIITAQSRA